jgi:hypothetical protein
MTSAIWKMIERPCRTIFAPILTNRSRNVVIDQQAVGRDKRSIIRHQAIDQARLVEANREPRHVRPEVPA